MSQHLVDYASKLFGLVNTKDLSNMQHIVLGDFSSRFPDGDKVTLVFETARTEELWDLAKSNVPRTTFDKFMASNPTALLLNGFQKAGITATDCLMNSYGSSEDLFKAFDFSFIRDEAVSAVSKTLEEELPQNIPSGFGMGTQTSVQPYTHQADVVDEDSEEAEVGGRLTARALATGQAILEQSEAILQALAKRSLGRYEEFNDEEYEEFIMTYENVPAEHVKVAFKHVLRSLWQNNQEEFANKLMNDVLNLLETKDGFMNSK